MLLNHSDITAMVNALSEPIKIDGDDSAGIFYEPGKQVSLFDGSIATTGPVLILDSISNALVTLNQTVITVNSVDYQAISSTRSRAGWYSLELTRDFEVIVDEQ